MAPKGRGASSGRSGGKGSASVRRKKSLAAAVPAKVIGHFPQRKVRRPDAPTDEIASPARVGAAAAGAIASMFPDISPNSAKTIAAVALAAAAAAQAQGRKGKGKAAATPAPPSTKPARSQLTQRVESRRGRAAESSPISKPPLSKQPRGTQLVVQPKASYGSYTFADVCAVGEMIRKKQLTIHQLRNPDNAVAKKYRVPASTMAEWCMDDAAKVPNGVTGSPHWLVERDVRRRTHRSKPGPGPVLGEGEDALMLAMGNAAKKSMPFEIEEVEEIIRDMCIRLKLVDHRGTAYSAYSDVSTLRDAFLKRCEAKGVCFVQREGQKLSTARHFATSDTESLKECREMINPVLLAFQEKHGAVPLEDTGNFDEAGLDLTSYAEDGNYLCLRSFGKSVLVPYDQSPHFTIIVGFCGKNKMVLMLIKIGPDYCAPHPYNAQCLQKERVVVIAQSPNGWVDRRLKVAFLQLQARQHRQHHQHHQHPTCLDLPYPTADRQPGLPARQARNGHQLRWPRLQRAQRGSDEAGRGQQHLPVVPARAHLRCAADV